LSQYAVGANEPELALNFIDNEYITNNSTSTFASAVTHSMSSNSVMTDGYGPELLTNGDFATGDTTGWATDGNPIVSRGVVNIPIDSGTSEYIEQTISTVSGKTYIVTYDYIDADSGSRISRLSVNDGTSGTFTGSQYADGISLNNSNGKVEGVFTAASANSTVRIINSTSTNGSYTLLDNISVREMPVLKWSPHNLQSYSDDVSQGSGSTGVTRTATTLTETTSTGEHRIQCGITTPVVGQKFTMALEAKSGTGSRNICFRGYGEGGADKYPVFDIVNGTVRQTGTSFTDVSITDVGDGYYLCKASVVTTSSFRWAVHMADETATLGTNAVHAYLGDGSSSVLLRKLRQYKGDLGGMTNNPDNSGNDADFVATSGSAKYLPRIGHHIYNGSAWVNEGLLAESEARTNLYDNNDSMHTNGGQNSTLSANGGTAPDGTDDAVKLLETTATGEHTVLMAQSVITTGKTYTCSVFVKSIGGRNVKFGFSAVNFPSATRLTFNLDNLTVSTPDQGTIQEVGNGWYRLSVTNTSDATGTRGDTNAVLQPLDGTTSSYAGDVTKGLLFYGMQIEEGATPSSYIPTASTTTATRAAETFTISSANLPWSSSAVSIAVDGRVTYTDNDDFNTVIFSKWEADNSNRLVLRIDTSSTRTGRLQSVQRESATERNSSSSDNYFSPDILIPYSMSAFFGISETQAAEGGVTFASNTPTGFPDLSATDLNLASTYMGTVGTFLIWDKDITDDGLVEATNPSLEPSLSLTFEGTGTNSFIVNDWSE
jgi:hypothetical protein